MTKMFQRKIESGDAQFISNQFKSPTRVDVDVLNRNSQSGATLACLHNQPEVLQVFIEEGANLRLKDCQGLTPLGYAIQNADKWNRDADDRWPRIMDLLVKQLGRKYVLQQAVAANFCKTLLYTIRDDTYAEEREYYESAIESTADEEIKTKTIIDLADAFNHLEIKELCLPKMWEI